MEGYDTCCLRMPLVPAKSENALAYVPGSHRLDSAFNQFSFGNLNPDAKTGIVQVDFSTVAAATIPDITADPQAFGVVSRDMQTGTSSL